MIYTLLILSNIVTLAYAAHRQYRLRELKALTSEDPGLRYARTIRKIQKHLENL